MKVSHRAVMRIVRAAFSLVAGILHIGAPDGFVRIVPDFVPWPRETVIFTGFCEIAGALALLTRRFRRAAGIALAADAVCVFPANIKHGLLVIPVVGMPVNWWYQGPRLALQPVIVWWALYSAAVTNWPFDRKRGA